MAVAIVLLGTLLPVDLLEAGEAGVGFPMLMITTRTDPLFVVQAVLAADAEGLTTSVVAVAALTERTTTIRKIGPFIAVQAVLLAEDVVRRPTSVVEVVALTVMIMGRE